MWFPNFELKPSFGFHNSKWCKTNVIRKAIKRQKKIGAVCKVIWFLGLDWQHVLQLLRIPLLPTPHFRVVDKWILGQRSFDDI